jgi:alkylation response protein AidB-like acyl-CoA dehydrogenase
MDFDLSEEQWLLDETVRRFCAEEIPLTRLAKLYDDDEKLDRKLWQGMGELGLHGIAIPESHGGSGLEMLDLAVVSEALGYGAAPGPFLGHALAGLALLWAGSEAQQKKWLPKLASGEAVGSFAAGEGKERWQPEEWGLSANGGMLMGGKRHVPYVSDADLFVVGLAGGGLGLVESGAPGLVAQEVDGVDRTRRLGRLSFDGTSCEMLPNANAEVCARLRDAALILVAADAYGGAWRAVEFTLDYAKTREQFGQTISHFQAVKHAIADMAAEIRPAQALHWYAAHCFDHRPAEAPRMAALAKAHLGERFNEVARQMVILHGGVGYTWRFHVQVWLKRAMFDRAWFGSPHVHRERAAELAGW